jgi:hypothetical protein
LSQALDLARRHGGEIVDVELAVLAEAFLVGPFHLVPGSGAGIDDAHRFHVFGQRRKAKVHEEGGGVEEFSGSASEGGGSTGGSGGRGVTVVGGDTGAITPIVIMLKGGLP